MCLEPLRQPRTTHDPHLHHTGITEDMLANVTTRLEDARACVMQHVWADTLLVGHSLENDLHALRLVHVNVLDTSLLFPHHKVRCGDDVVSVVGG